MNEKVPLDPTCFHYLESVASPRVRTFIVETAPIVWADLSQPGMGGPANCLAAQSFWAMHLAAARIPFELLGSQTVLGSHELGGYRIPSGELVDHHFLAVGEALALFDPTARAEHIGHTAEMPLDRYVVASGAPFPAWRHRQLEKR